MISKSAEGCQSRGGAERPPWRSLAAHLRGVFGRPLRKVPIDPGFGCPHRPAGAGGGGCSFCLPEAFVPAGALAGGTPAQQLDRALARDPALAGGCLPYLQAGSATHAPPERFAALAGGLLRRPEAAGLFVATRPDCVGAAHLDALAEWRGRRLVWLELGLPSASEATLARVGRGHGAAAFADARALARERGLPVCAHVILGLPGEGEEEMAATARFLARLGVEGVKLHQLQVLRGTAMEAEWRAGGVEALPLARYAALAARFLAALPAGTVVHRVAADAPDRLLLAPRWEGGRAAARAAVARALVRLREGERAERCGGAGGAPRSR